MWILPRQPSLRMYQLHAPTPHSQHVHTSHPHRSHPHEHHQPHQSHLLGADMPGPRREAGERCVSIHCTVSSHVDPSFLCTGCPPLQLTSFCRPVSGAGRPHLLQVGTPTASATSCMKKIICKVHRRQSALTTNHLIHTRLNLMS